MPDDQRLHSRAHHLSLIMPIPQYKNTGPVDCTVKPDLSQVKGKSVIVTGGELPTHLLLQAGRLISMQAPMV